MFHIDFAAVIKAQRKTHTASGYSTERMWIPTENKVNNDGTLVRASQEATVEN